MKKKNLIKLLLIVFVLLLVLFVAFIFIFKKDDKKLKLECEIKLIKSKIFDMDLSLYVYEKSGNPFDKYIFTITGKDKTDFPAQDLIKSLNNKLASVKNKKGVKYKITEKENLISLELTVDYKNVNFKNDFDLLDFRDTSLSIDELKAQMEGLGATCESY